MYEDLCATDVARKILMCQVNDPQDDAGPIRQPVNTGGKEAPKARHSIATVAGRLKNAVSFTPGFSPVVDAC
jgi:hypothetical protein